MIELLTQHPVAAALVALAALAIGFGALLGFASVRYAVTGNPIVEQILEKLPQTQCGQCGHPGCRPYAEAIAAGEPINKCPPGGQATINALADLLHVEAPALDAEHGEEKPRTVAFIREDECIGCTKCIQCTGCDLCVEPCPVDCIEMRPVPSSAHGWSWELPRRAAPRASLIASDAPAERAA